MLFKKFYVFIFHLEKNFLLQEMVGGVGVGATPSPFLCDPSYRCIYAKIKNIEEKMPDITNSATNASLNAKTN